MTSIRKLGLACLGIVLTLGAVILEVNFDIWQTVLDRMRQLANVALNWSPPLIPVLFIVGVVAIILVWKLPQFQVAHSKSLTDENRFDRENEARKTVAQILAGAFLLAGLYSSVQTFNLSREGQITDRFTKAIDQLGAIDGTGKPKLEVRLGGIYALERIARDSMRDDAAIMEVLTAYVREHSPNESGGQATGKVRQPVGNLRNRSNEASKLAADIQAILLVISKLEYKYDVRNLDLSSTDLHSSGIFGNFIGADFHNANLSYADLIGANLSDADFTGADLTSAHFGGSYLISTRFQGAHLRGATFLGAYVKNINFSGVDLTDVDISQAQLQTSFGDKDTILPPGLDVPSGWKK